MCIAVELVSSVDFATSVSSFLAEGDGKGRSNKSFTTENTETAEPDALGSDRGGNRRPRNAIGLSSRTQVAPGGAEGRWRLPSAKGQDIERGRR